MCDDPRCELELPQRGLAVHPFAGAALGMSEAVRSLRKTTGMEQQLQQLLVVLHHLTKPLAWAEDFFSAGSHRFRWE